MKHNRVVQLVAILIAIACLAGASFLAPRISRQRADLFPQVSAEGRPPRYVLAAAALGTFRGLAVDALWYRAEMLKRQGKFFDAKTLRDWITTLQPRFPKVWGYQAWDMAYNISVATNTPEERWNWVRKGIRLLRDQGIPNNPRAVGLYRELAWIFFHKIGLYTDDMHWYYKLQLAQEWQELLGAPTEGATTAQALARFAPIADAAERYFMFDKPTRKMLDQVKALAAADPDLADRIKKLEDERLTPFRRHLRHLQSSLKSTRPDLVTAIDNIDHEIQARLKRAEKNPVTLLIADHPEVKPLIAQIRAMGLDLNADTLKRIGRIKMLIRYTSLNLVKQRAGELLDATDQALLPLVDNSANAQAMASLLNYLRADALLHAYHMNPVVMYELMQAYGPFDWRHPASHAVYWAYLGVKKSGQLRDATKYDILNTDRQVIQAIQDLFHAGRVNYDPISGRIDLLPDPRFIPAYDKAMKQAIARAKETTWRGHGNVTTFEAGHENFLIRAVVYAYIYGQIDDARKYYAEVRQLYGDKPHNLRSGRYLQPLSDFVIHQLQEDWGMQNVARPFVAAMLQRGFRQGLANGRMDVYQRFVGLAKQMYEQYQKERKSPTPNAPRERLLMLPWEQTFTDTYVEYMRLPTSAASLMERARVYANTPPALQQKAWPRFHDVTDSQAQQMGLNAALMFPKPPGVEEQKIQPRSTVPKADDTVERK